ncbi:hypothetical protein [Mycobacterium parmense]|uniref:hypothetical protein n=1 Tax=Mycobacterium parmense TaxID=185642 RepID=UPI0013747E41|nr:hypothetical protein [Mycobacterium parmense]MCV7353614.1 hypothetical protein [Mycobacterium parmense]
MAERRYQAVMAVDEALNHATVITELMSTLAHVRRQRRRNPFPLSIIKESV